MPPLQRGMTMDEVRRALPGWRESLPSAVLSPDRTHLFYTLDFKRPYPGTGSLRLTFDNGRLLIWGEPAEPGLGAGQDPAASA